MVDGYKKYEMKKIYVIIGSTSGGVSGGIIYHLNKLNYMKKKGWESLILSSDDGQVMVPAISDFIWGNYTFLKQFPNSYPNKLLSDKLQLILNLFEEKAASDIIIESSTETTALWGELFARKLKCRHIIIYINEFSLCMNSSLALFFKFKYNRGELACISKQHMIKIFKKYWIVDENNARALPCSCTNSLQKCDSKYNLLALSGKTIGYIGRIDKPFFNNMLSEILDYCKSNKNIHYNLFIFGGSNQAKAVNILKKRCSIHKNISLIVTGFIYPIPFEATQQLDVIFACAGSAVVAYKTGKPAIRIDNVDYKLSGVIKSQNPLILEMCPLGNTYSKYLSWILESTPKISIKKYDLSIDEINTERKLDEHIRFINNISSELLYYNIGNIGPVDILRG